MINFCQDVKRRISLKSLAVLCSLYFYKKKIELLLQQFNKNDVVKIVFCFSALYLFIRGGLIRRKKTVFPTCYFIEAGFMESSHEEFKPNDGVDDDDEEHQQGDVDERNDGHEDSIHDDLKTRYSRDQSQRPQNTEGSQSFDVKAFYL